MQNMTPLYMVVLICMFVVVNIMWEMGRRGTSLECACTSHTTWWIIYIGVEVCTHILPLHIIIHSTYR